jgi:hypothetical protein
VSEELASGSERCEVCGEALVEGECRNDSDPNHDRIQDEIWDERGTREDL